MTKTDQTIETSPASSAGTASTASSAGQTSPASTVQILGATTIGDSQTSVLFTISTVQDGSAASNSGAVRHGTVTVADSLGRVRVTTVVDGACLSSYKLDPNEADDAYDVVAAEMMRIPACALPMGTSSIEGIAAVISAYVTGGRSEWY